MTETLEVPEAAPPEHGLRGGVLGLFDSVIMGIAGRCAGVFHRIHDGLPLFRRRSR